MALGDPFDFSGDPNAPGFLGQSPAFWQHLAQFGGNLSAAANARTSTGHLANGPDFTGSLGAAIGQTMDQGLTQARSRSQMAGNAAATRGQQLQNQITESSLPMTLARNQMMADYWKNPNDPRFQMPDFGGGQGGAGPSGAADLSGAVHRLESGGSMAPGITGDGGAAAGPMQVHQAALDDVNRATGNNYTLDQVRADPMLGMSVGQRYLQMQQQRFPGRPDLALAAYNAGPTATQQAVNSGAGIGGLPQSTQSYVQRGLGGGSPQQAESLAQQYETHARQYQQQADWLQRMQGFGVPKPGDPALLRTMAGQYNEAAIKLRGAAPTAGAEAGAKADVEQRTAGPIQAAKSRAESQNKPTTDRYGNMYVMGQDGQWQYLGRGSEVKPSFNQTTGNFEYQDVGGVGIGAQQPAGGQAPGAGGNVIEKPGPGAEGFLKGAANVQQNFIEHDNKMVDEDLAHVIENVLPAKQQLFQLRSLIGSADTGAAGELRSTFKNWVQTFAPDFVSQITGDATPAQEFKKIALMGAGKQERGDLGSKGGFRAMEMYVNANPNLDMQPDANLHMANALLVSHQSREDYATGATDFFNKQIKGVQDSGSTKGYKKVSSYDQQFIQKMRPELYASAIQAINGSPSSIWAKGLTAKQQQAVGGILQRADPSAKVKVLDPRTGQDVLMPVTDFSNTFAPTDVAGGTNGG